MEIKTHENQYLKNCLNCENEVSSLDEEHLFCTQCGFPIRNECHGTSKFNDGYGNNPVNHDIEDDSYVLNPEDAFCPKCASASLFNVKGLIELRHPEVEIIEPQSQLRFDDDEMPF